MKIDLQQVESLRCAIAQDLGVLLTPQDAEFCAHALLAYGLLLAEEDLPTIK